MKGKLFGLALLSVAYPVDFVLRLVSKEWRKELAACEAANNR